MMVNGRRAASVVAVRRAGAVAPAARQARRAVLATSTHRALPAGYGELRE